MKDVINPGECWRGYNAGELYVIHILAHSEVARDEYDEQVIYQRANEDGTVWGPVYARPLKDWLGSVVTPKGPRARYVKVVAQ